MGIVSTRRYSCEIEDGPNRDRILDSLKHALDERVVIPVYFEIVQETISELDEVSSRRLKVKDVVITAFKYDVSKKHYHREHEQFEKNENDQCMIEGTMQVCFHPEAICGGNLHMIYKQCSFNASYNTHTRKGRMAITVYEKRPG